MKEIFNSKEMKRFEKGHFIKENSYFFMQKAGKIDLKSLVTCHYELDEINIAIEDMRSGKTAGRIMINL